MRKNLMYFSLICFFTLGAIIAVFSITEMDKTVTKEFNSNPEESADWPIYEFNKVMENADLVAFVTVKDTEEHPLFEKDARYSNSKLAKLSLDEVLYSSSISESLNEIKLDQATEFVVPGESYLMFLNKNGDYYYEVDGNSKVKNENGKYNVLIPNIEGNYLKQDFNEKFDLKLKEFEK